MENKNNETNEIIETSVDTEIKVKVKKEKKNPFKALIAKIKTLRGKKIRNQQLWKRGGYSLAITALVLAALILFNWMVSALADRFNLEFDMSAQKTNSISEENIEYLKNLEYEVSVTICGSEDEYPDYMSYYSQNYYNATGSSEYFSQTIKLIEKYSDYNENIKIRYVDPQSTEFTAISQAYSSYGLMYGDIIVTCTRTDVANSNERVRVVTFEDIYTLTDESGYASYGYDTYTISGNNIETALTSAISYVVSADSKKVAFITGHSAEDYTSAMRELLGANNYEITNISDAIITEVSSEYDAVIIMAPSIDFMGTELDAISEFLDNDGKLGKGLMFFADATCPALPNLYDFLEQWGISVGEGMLHETESNNHITDDPTTMGIYAAEEPDEEISGLLSNFNYCISGYNVPMTTCDVSEALIKSFPILQTLDSVVVAPVGADKSWSDYSEDDMALYDGIIQSRKSTYDSDNNEIISYVMAFGSVEYVESQWYSYSNLSNQDITLAVADRACQVEDSGMKFTSKTITSESFYDEVTEDATTIIKIIFVFIIPIAMVVLGIYIYIRRKNAR